MLKFCILYIFINIYEKSVRRIISLYPPFDYSCLEEIFLKLNKKCHRAYVPTTAGNRPYSEKTTTCVFNSHSNELCVSPEINICYLPNWSQSVLKILVDPCNQDWGEHFPSTYQLCIVLFFPFVCLYFYVHKVLAFFPCGFSLKGPYSQIPDRSSADQNASFNRIPDVVKIKYIVLSSAI